MPPEATMIPILAQPKQSDVFKSISENVSGNSDPKIFYAVMLGIAAIVFLLVVSSALRKRQSRPKGVNHQGKLIKEMTKRVSLRKSEIRALKTIAAEQGCSSPLTLVLCPSLLAKGINARGKADRKWAMMVARKVGLTAAKREK
jgi:hypothetical protein